MDNGVITFREISKYISHRNFPASDKVGVAYEDDLREFFLDNQGATSEVLKSLRDRIKNIPESEITLENAEKFIRLRKDGRSEPEECPIRDYLVLKNAIEWLRPLFWDGMGRAHRKEIASVEKAEEPAAKRQQRLAI